MKTVKLFVFDVGDDIYCVSEWEAKNLGKTEEQISKECKYPGIWKELKLKPAESELEREAKAKTLIGDAFSGFRKDDDLLPAAYFETICDSWDGKSTSMAAFGKLHPNVSDKITIAINRHLRPSVLTDFFTTNSNDNIPPSLEESQ